METRWMYVTSENFEQLREEAKGVCVIPMGCVEKHGLHLPLGTDVFEADALAYMASQIEPVCIFPTFIFGDVPENYPAMAPGSITLPVETEMLLLDQLCDQIARNGFKKIIILNTHGGNKAWLTTFLRKLENRPHDYVVVVVEMKSEIAGRIAQRILDDGREAFPDLTDEDVELLMMYLREGKKSGGHATFGETAYTIGAYPETVKMDRLGIVDGRPKPFPTKFQEAGIQVRDGGFFVKCPHCMSGEDPVGCNEQIGKAALKVESERIAYAFKVMKEDEDLLRWHNQLWGTNI